MNGSNWVVHYDDNYSFWTVHYDDNFYSDQSNLEKEKMCLRAKGVVFKDLLWLVKNKTFFQYPLFR